jgi:hypothetical protein
MFTVLPWPDIALVIMPQLLQATETTNFNSAATILTYLSFGRLPPSRLTTVLLNVILRYFKFTILLFPPPPPSLQDAWQME